MTPKDNNDARYLLLLGALEVAAETHARAKANSDGDTGLYRRNARLLLHRAAIDYADMVRALARSRAR